MKAARRIVLFTLFAGLLVVAAPTAAQTTRTLTVTPDTGLVDGDVVQLEGSGFTPSDDVYFCQGVMATTPDPSNCGGPIASVPADEAGDFSASYTVQRFMTPSSVGATIDCAQPSAKLRHWCVRLLLAQPWLRIRPAHVHSPAAEDARGHA